MIIYKTINLINNKIYIGQSNKNSKYYLGSGKLLKRAILKYGKINFKKEIIIEGNFNELLVNDLERHYIRLHNSTNLKIGYNLELGGVGGRNKTITTEHKLKISKANLGTKWTKERKLKLSNSRKGIKFSKEHIENLSKNSKRLPNRSVPILQYDLQNNFIKEFKSIKEATVLLNLSQSSISMCCLNKRSTYKGFKFKYRTYENSSS